MKFSFIIYLPYIKTIVNKLSDSEFDALIWEYKNFNDNSSQNSNTSSDIIISDISISDEEYRPIMNYDEDSDPYDDNVMFDYYSDSDEEGEKFFYMGNRQYRIIDNSSSKMSDDNLDHIDNNTVYDFLGIDTELNSAFVNDDVSISDHDKVINILSQEPTRKNIRKMVKMIERFGLENFFKEYCENPDLVARLAAEVETSTWETIINKICTIDESKKTKTKSKKITNELKEMLKKIKNIKNLNCDDIKTTISDCYSSITSSWQIIIQKYVLLFPKTDFMEDKIQRQIYEYISKFTTSEFFVSAYQYKHYNRCVDRDLVDLFEKEPCYIIVVILDTLLKDLKYLKNEFRKNSYSYIQDEIKYLTTIISEFSNLVEAILNIISH